MATVRRRFIDEQGDKRVEYALNRRDTTPVYGGPVYEKHCAYCRDGELHSQALHQVTVAEARRVQRGFLQQPPPPPAGRHQRLYTYTPWEALKGSVSLWLRHLVEAGRAALDDTVWEGADGSYFVGEFSVEEEVDMAERDYEVTDAGAVREWLEDNEEAGND